MRSDVKDRHQAPAQGRCRGHPQESSSRSLATAGRSDEQPCDDAERRWRLVEHCAGQGENLIGGRGVEGDVPDDLAAVVRHPGSKSVLTGDELAELMGQVRRVTVRSSYDGRNVLAAVEV